MSERARIEHRAMHDKKHVLHKAEHLVRHEEKETIHEWKHELHHDKKRFEVEAVQLDDNDV